MGGQVQGNEGRGWRRDRRGEETCGLMMEAAEESSFPASRSWLLTFKRAALARRYSSRVLLAPPRFTRSKFNQGRFSASPALPFQGHFFF
jgi:hypothetical protein